MGDTQRTEEASGGAAAADLSRRQPSGVYRRGKTVWRISESVEGGLKVAGTRVCSPAPVAVRITDSTDVTIRGVRIGAPPSCGYFFGRCSFNFSVGRSVVSKLMLASAPNLRYWL